LTQGIALYDAQHHRASVLLYGEDTGVVCRCHDALILWLLGYPEQGRAQTDDALTLAQQSAHPLSLAYALTFAATCYHYRREVSAAQECAEALISLAMEQGFPYWMAIGAIRCGWAMVHQGQAQEGIAQMQQGLTAWRAIGAGIGRPYWLALLAEVYGTMEQPEAGLIALTEALTLAETTRERLNEPELYRLKGALLLQQSADNYTEAETCFQHALAITRHQQAKSFELRAATSLARLWQQQGKRQEAHDLLTPVYGWFTEGFDTTDLQEAKTLLEELAG
jgi:predicted ATPase